MHSSTRSIKRIGRSTCSQSIPSSSCRNLAIATSYPWPYWSTLPAGSSSSVASSSSSPSSPSNCISLKTNGTGCSPFSKSSIWSLSYSTTRPPSTLVGSNTDLDPRGVDYSIFEQRSSEYQQAEYQQEPLDVKFVSHTSEGASLSPATELLRRLIQNNNYTTASQVLSELEALDSPPTDSIVEFSFAAVWALENGRTQEMLRWMRLCPAVARNHQMLPQRKVDVLSNNFRKMLTLLLDTSGSDLKLLQDACFIVAEKGFASLTEMTLVHILRFGVHRSSTTRSKDAWNYFSSLLTIAAREKSSAGGAALYAIRRMYNTSVRTLLLAGRYQEALDWAFRSLEADESDHMIQYTVRLGPFTKQLLIQELVKAGPIYIEKARQLQLSLEIQGKMPPSLMVDNVLAKFNQQKQKKQDMLNMAPDGDVSPLDAALRDMIADGDIIGARSHLLLVLREAARPKVFSDADLQDDGDDGFTNFDYLPAATTLIQMFDYVDNLGLVPETSSLVEPVSMQESSDASYFPISTCSSSSSPSPPTPVIEESVLSRLRFFKPVWKALESVRGGRGLWETARIHSYVQRGEWFKAAKFYASKNGFRMPSGGITPELLNLTFNGREKHVFENPRGDLWPGTHAINIMLKAIVGHCVETCNYGLLETVYETWKKNIRPKPDASIQRLVQSHQQQQEQEQDELLQKEQEEWLHQDATGLAFESWVPRYQPDSYSFDPFLWAFAHERVDSIDAYGVRRYQIFSTRNKAFAVIQEMMNQFSIRPSTASWAIVLGTLARKETLWDSVGKIIAHAMGVRIDDKTPKAPVDFPEANIETYSAIINGLVQGQEMIQEAAKIRDDLLQRIQDPKALQQQTENNPNDLFWIDLLRRWNQVGHVTDDRRKWTSKTFVSKSRAIYQLRYLWEQEQKRANNSDDHNSMSDSRWN